MKIRSLLLCLTLGVPVLTTRASGMSEYVPIDWTGIDQQEQVATIRRLHDDYGFRRFVLIGPFRKEFAGDLTLRDFEELGNSLAWARRQLADLSDVELGWWLVPTLRMNGGRGVDPIVNSDGTPSAGCCPLSPSFTEGLREKVSACLRRGRPRFIFVEDDYTLCNNAGQTNMKGCFCARHLKEFAARVGRDYTGAEIAALFDYPTDSNRPLREAFAKLSRDSLAKLAGEVRKAIDSVDPSVRVCLCQSACCDMDGDDTEAVARAFAGKTRPWVRVCGAAYMNENNPSALPPKIAHVAWSVQHLPKDFEVIHETDSYPHTRFYNSSLFLGSELCAALMAGVDGTYYYCTAYTDAPLEDDGYADWMRRNRSRLETVRAVRATMKPCGVRAVYTPAEVYLRRGHLRQGVFGGLPTAAGFLGKMGFPLTTEEGVAPSVLFGNTAEVLSDEELRKLLSGGVLLDGEAAVILTRRGFASLIGCTAETMPPTIAFTAEEIQPIAGCTAKGRRLFTVQAASGVATTSFAGLALLKPIDGTEVWSQFVDYYGKGVAPSVIFSRNALGGRVGVLHLSPSYGYGSNGATYSFRKQELLHRLFARLSAEELDVTAPKTPASWLFAAKNDNELLVMLENLCGEPRKDVELAFAKKWRDGRVARLDEKGGWVDCGTADAIFHVAEEWYTPMAPAFFKVSRK